MSKVESILKKSAITGGASFSIDHASEMLGRLQRGEKICLLYTNSKHNGFDEITLAQARKLKEHTKEVEYLGTANRYHL